MSIGERRAVMCYMIDRAAQFKPSSGYQTFVEDMIRDIAQGEHLASYSAGEYDDLKERVDKILQTRSGKERRVGDRRAQDRRLDDRSRKRTQAVRKSVGK